MNPKQFEKLKSLSNMVKDARCACKPYDDIHDCDWFSNYRQLERGMAERAPEIFAEIETLRAKLEKAEKVVEAFHKGVRRVISVPMEFSDACEALRKYQDRKYRDVLRIDEWGETK